MLLLLTLWLNELTSSASLLNSWKPCAASRALCLSSARSFIFCRLSKTSFLLLSILLKKERLNYWNLTMDRSMYMIKNIHYKLSLPAMIHWIFRISVIKWMMITYWSLSGCPSAILLSAISSKSFNFSSCTSNVFSKSSWRLNKVSTSSTVSFWKKYINQ